MNAVAGLPTGLTDTGSRSATVEAERRLPLLAVIFVLAVLLPVRLWAGPLLLTSVRIVLLIVVIPLTINLFRGKYGRILPTDLLFLTHLGWIGVSLYVTSPELVVGQMGSVGVEFWGGYLVGRATVRNKRQFRALILLLATAVVLLLPAVFQELRTGRPPVIDLLHKLPGVTSDEVVTIERRMNLERVQAVFSHPIHWGLFCSSLISLLFVGLKGTIGPTRKYFLTAAALFGTLSSLSSGAILPIVLQVGLIGWAIAFRTVPARWRILAALFAVAWVIVDILSNRSPLMVFLSRATFSAHNAYWRAQIFEWGMMNIFGDAERGIPSARLFGIGFADWVRPHYMFSGSMDNFWLVMGVRYGVPGFLTVAAGYLWLVWSVARHALREGSPTWRLRRAWVIAFFSLSLTLCTVHIWTAAYAYVFFLLGTGAWFLSAPEEDRDGGAPVAVAQPDAAAGATARAAYSRFAGRAAPEPAASPSGRNAGIRYARGAAPEPDPVSRAGAERKPDGETAFRRAGRPGLHRRSRA